MKKIFTKLSLFLGFILLCNGLQAQSLDQAKKLYNEGQYAEAKPAFEKLVKQAPSNASYNHWYGVCCYETGDLIGAEKHLGIAAKRKVQEAYRYLAEVYYQTYRFDESSEMWDEYIELLTKKKQNTEVATARQELAEKARRMMDKTEDIQILDSIVVDKKDFLSAYKLSEESGKLMYFNDFFEDEAPVESSVYMNQKGDKVYYAHESGTDNYCLFSQSKLMDTWGDEKKLPMNINSNSDDNYPFVLPDGVTVYYASKGNGSLGGYDLFVTRYNMNADTYLTPEQLSMPFNSPANDYMIVFDEVKGLGWFVSDRYQPEDKVCVYLFIPNKDHIRFESDDIMAKRARASIASIQDSWPEGSNYSDLIRLAHQEIPYGKVEIKKDFELIINDNTVYYTLDEIQSPNAKKAYEKVIDINKQIKDINAKLDDLRSSYATGNPAKKEQLKTSILQMEEQLNELLPQSSELEKQTRNIEIQYLQKKH